MKSKEEIQYRLNNITSKLKTKEYKDETIFRAIYNYLQIEKEVLEWVLKGDE